MRNKILAIAMLFCAVYSSSTYAVLESYELMKNLTKYEADIIEDSRNLLEIKPFSKMDIKAVPSIRELEEREPQVQSKDEIREFLIHILVNDYRVMTSKKGSKEMQLKRLTRLQTLTEQATWKMIAKRAPSPLRKAVSRVEIILAEHKKSLIY